MASGCTTCQLVARRDRGDAPPWDNILRTPGWDLVHSFNTSLEGWLVLVARRHIASLAEMNVTESEELGPMIKQVSEALQTVTGCEKTYIAQFAESPDHRHVHIHVVPRMADLPAEQLGPRVFSAIGADDHHRVSESRMDELTMALRAVIGA